MCCVYQLVSIITTASIAVLFCRSASRGHLEVAAFLLHQELLVELLDEVNLALFPQLVREVLRVSVPEGQPEV